MWSALRQEATSPGGSTPAPAPGTAAPATTADGGAGDNTGNDSGSGSGNDMALIPDDLEYVAAVSTMPDDDCDYGTADEHHQQQQQDDAGNENDVSRTSTSVQSIINGGDDDAGDEENAAEPDANANAEEAEEADTSFQAPDSILNFLAEAESNLNAVLADDAIGGSATNNNDGGAKIEYYDSDEDITTNKLGEELRRARLHEILAANANAASDNNGNGINSNNNYDGNGTLSTPGGRTPLLNDGGGSTEVCIDGSAASLSTRNAIAGATSATAGGDGHDDVLSPMTATALFSPPRTRRGTRYSTSNNNANTKNASNNARNGRRSTMGVGRLSTGSTAAEDEARVVAAHQRQIMETFDDSDDLPLVDDGDQVEVNMEADASSSSSGGIAGGNGIAIVVDEDVLADDGDHDATADAGSDMDMDESAMVDSLPDVMVDDDEEEEEESAMAESLPDIESEVGADDEGEGGDDQNLGEDRIMTEDDEEEETSDDAIIRQLEEARLDQERFAAEERAAAEASKAAAAEARRLEKQRLLDEPTIAEEQDAEVDVDADNDDVGELEGEYDPDEIIARIEEEDRLEQQRLAAIEAERLEQERLEQERLAAIEAERLEQERLEQERIAAEKAEAERLELERLEQERIAAEKAEAERLEQERIEQERIAAEKAEAERLEQERLEQERLEQERLEQERIEQERLEQERIEQERIAAEKAEAERLEQERLEQERRAAIAAEEAAAAKAAEEAEARRVAEERRLAEEKLIADMKAAKARREEELRLAAAKKAEEERAERERLEELARVEAENQRLAAERLERERKAAEISAEAERNRKEQERIEEEKAKRQAAMERARIMKAEQDAERERIARQKKEDEAELQRLADLKREEEEKAAAAAEAKLIAEEERRAAEEAERHRLAEEEAKRHRLQEEEKARIEAEREAASAVAVDQALVDETSVHRSASSSLICDDGDGDMDVDDELFFPNRETSRPVAPAPVPSPAKSSRSTESKKAKTSKSKKMPTNTSSMSKKGASQRSRPVTSVVTDRKAKSSAISKPKISSKKETPATRTSSSRSSALAQPKVSSRKPALPKFTNTSSAKPSNESKKPRPSIQQPRPTKASMARIERSKPRAGTSTSVANAKENKAPKSSARRTGTPSVDAISRLSKPSTSKKTPSLTTEERQALECKKQFRARPMPKAGASTSRPANSIAGTSIDTISPTSRKPRATSRKRLTVPKPPRLSTLQRGGEKPVPTITGEQPPVFSPKKDTQTPAKSKPLRLTQPKPFKLSSTNSSTPSRPADVSTPRAKAPPTLAESMEMFMKKGLRDSEPMPISSTPRGPNGLTQPKPFRLSIGTPSSRPPPKSAAQLEEEMMEYNRAHPFKAREIGEGVEEVIARSTSESRPARPPTAPRTRLTTPKPFRLSHTNHVQAPTMATEEIEARECEKQFKARPMPGGRPAHSRLSMPTHASVHASIANQTPEPQRKPVNVKSIRPPRLVSELRVERREEVRVRSERNAKEILAEKKRRDRLRRQEEAEANISNTPFSGSHLTEPEPFNLESVQRHEVCQMELEQKRREALGPSPPKRAPRQPGELTQPRPFRLESDVRGERSRQELQEKIDREEAEQEEKRKVRARPITRFKNNTSQHRPPPKPLAQPFSPELAMKTRSRQRKEYDEAAELRREEEMLNKRMLEEQKQAELDAEIQELRRLPVEEGGMQFRAGEINEVWENRRF